MDFNDIVKPRGRSKTRKSNRSESPLTRQQKRLLDEKEQHSEDEAHNTNTNEVTSSVPDKNSYLKNDLSDARRVSRTSVSAYSYTSSKHVYGTNGAMSGDHDCRKRHLSTNIKQEPGLYENDRYSLKYFCFFVETMKRYLNKDEKIFKYAFLFFIVSIFVFLLFYRSTSTPPDTTSINEELIKTFQNEIEKRDETIKQLTNTLIGFNATLIGFENTLVSIEKRLKILDAKNAVVDSVKNDLEKMSSDHVLLVSKVTEFHIEDRNRHEEIEIKLKKQNDFNEGIKHNVTKEISMMQNNTKDMVHTEIKRELKREREKYYGENSLCIGEECRQRSSNTMAVIQAALEVDRADTLGFTDYALQSGGGSIHERYHSETCEFGNPTIKLFGLPIYVDPTSPRLAITASNNPGDCWNMRGSEGFLVVKLATEIQPTMISLEHLDKNLDKYSKYMYKMAPRSFQVYAWMDVNGKKKVHLGDYTYQREGSTIQTFSFRKKAPDAVQYVELRILSNWGNPDCTSIYRFRVHGVSIDWEDEE